MNKLTLKGVKRSQEVTYKNPDLGIEFDFVLTPNVVDGMIEAQEKQQAEMMKILKVEINTDGFSNGKQKNPDNVVKFDENIGIDSILAVSKINYFEDVIFSIDELDKDIVVKHFEDNFGGLSKVKYNLFLTQMEDLLLKEITPETPR